MRSPLTVCVCVGMYRNIPQPTSDTADGRRTTLFHVPVRHTPRVRSLIGDPHLRLGPQRVVGGSDERTHETENTPLRFQSPRVYALRFTVWIRVLTTDFNSEWWWVGSTFRSLVGPMPVPSGRHLQSRLSVVVGDLQL